MATRTYSTDTTCPKCKSPIRDHLVTLVYEGLGTCFDFQCPCCETMLEIEVEPIPAFTIRASGPTPVAADEGGAVTVIDAIDDPQGLITGKPGRFYPARLSR